MHFKISTSLLLATVLALLLCTSVHSAGKQKGKGKEGKGKRERRVKLSTGVKLRYVVEGPRDSTSPPIIFLHGFTDSSHSWSDTTPHLSEDYLTYALSQRGHGDSERPLHGYTMPQFAEDVIAFMDKLEIEQAVLVGHSMGALIAHQVASVYPQRVSQMVLIGSGVTGVRNEVFTFLWDEIFGLADFVDPIDPDFIEEFQAAPNPVDPDFFATVLEDSAKVPARVWKAAARGLLTDDHSDFLDNVVAPTLILWGTVDPVFLESDQEALQAAISDTTFIPYSDAGHNTHWEQPENVANDIRDFIQ